MEHNVDQVIRGKILQVELQPVAWQRARVWQAVSDAPATHRNRRHIIYAAASIAIASLVFTGLYTCRQLALREEIASLESRLGKKLLEREMPVPSASGDIRRCQDIETPSIRREVPSRKRPTRVAIAAATVAIPAADEPQEIKTVVTSSEVPISIQEIFAPTDDAPAQVTAIIGFIPTEPRTSEQPKVKTRKLRIFRSREPDNGSFPMAESRFITARIN